MCYHVKPFQSILYNSACIEVFRHFNIQVNIECLIRKYNFAIKFQIKIFLKYFLFDNFKAVLKF